MDFGATILRLALLAFVRKTDEGWASRLVLEIEVITGPDAESEIGRAWNPARPRQEERDANCAQDAPLRRRACLTVSLADPTSSFVAEGYQGVYAGGAASGNEAGQSGYGYEEGGAGYEG